MTDRMGGYWLGTRLGGHAREVYDESGARYALTPLPTGPRAADAVEAARRVRSLRVAAAMDACLDDDVPYLVSEYVEGLSVREAVTRHGPFAVDDLYRLATATATALAAVHEAGTAHGRLGPDSVLLSAGGPVLVGLGVAPEGRTAADDVRDLGRLLVFAAGGRPRAETSGAETPPAADPEAPRAGSPEADGRKRRLSGSSGSSGAREGSGPMDRALRELAGAALRDDPEQRPSARQLLLSLLDAPQSQQGTLLPPEPPHDPPLGARAEAVYAELGRTEQELVPEVFLRLVTLDAMGTETRRHAGHAELISGRTPGQAAAVGRILDVYGEAGLLQHVQDGPGVLIRCAALLRAWPRLREWVEAERDGLAVHRELAEAARRWEECGRRDGELFADDALDRALAWAANGRRRLTLTAEEQGFLDAGRALGRRRGRGRRGIMAALLSAALVVAVLAVTAAVWQNGTAEERLELAMARVAASRAQALRAADPVTARRLALAAWRLAPVPEARAALVEAAADPAVRVFADPHATSGSLHALSVDGTRLAALTDGTLRVFDVRSGRPAAQAAGPEQSVRAMAWSPDGRTLALVGVDRTYLWDTTSGSGVGPPFGRGLGAPGHHAAWFSPGGGLLFAAARQSGERWGWDLRARRAVFAGEYAVVGPGDRMALVFAGSRSQAGRLDTKARTDLPWLDRMPWEYTAFAPDGDRVAIAEEQGVQIYDLGGTPTLPGRLRPSPGVLRFSPDGRLLASTDSERVRVWRVSDGLLLLDRQVSPVGVDRPVQAAPAADGRWLRVLAGRGTVLTVDLAHAPDTGSAERLATSLCAGYGGPSPAEWARHLPELPHREVCGG